MMYSSQTHLVYGADGKRKNTRAVRWRQRYTAERHDVLEKLMSMNPATRQSGLFKRKRSNKIRIPIELHPQYNFIGLIIGPRGKTQKELESKTGCKIAIRGRGSVKQGARGRRDGKVMDSDDEPLHVVVTGDDQRSVDAATDMINQMLVVIDDEKNVHKQLQLRELALLNGTLKDDEYCQICGEKGHRSFECPKRFSMNKKNTVQIKCAICGDTSHPTRDCTQKPAERPANTKEMDSDYMSFMAELDGKKVEKATPQAPPGAPTLPSRGVGSLPPPPANRPNLPPPPPSTVGVPPRTNLPIPSGIPPPPPPPNVGTTGLPPPPPNVVGGALLPPPPPSGISGVPPPMPPPPGNTNHQYGNSNHYQQQQPNQQYGNPNHGGPRHDGGGSGNYYGGNGGHGQQSNQQQQQYSMHNQQQQQPNQQKQQPPNQQQQPNQPQQPQTWDYTAYYGQGNGNGNGAAGGAGGFNWWEN